MFKDIWVQPVKKNASNFAESKQFIWIVSDINSAFKNFINYD